MLTELFHVVVIVHVLKDYAWCMKDLVTDPVKNMEVAIANVTRDMEDTVDDLNKTTEGPVDESARNVDGRLTDRVNKVKVPTSDPVKNVEGAAVARSVEGPVDGHVKNVEDPVPVRKMEDPVDDAARSVEGPVIDPFMMKDSVADLDKRMGRRVVVPTRRAEGPPSKHANVKGQAADPTRRVEGPVGIRMCQLLCDRDGWCGTIDYDEIGVTCNLLARSSNNRRTPLKKRGLDGFCRTIHTRQGSIKCVVITRQATDRSLDKVSEAPKAKVKRTAKTSTCSEVPIKAKKTSLVKIIGRQIYKIKNLVIHIHRITDLQLKFKKKFCSLIIFVKIKYLLNPMIYKAVLCHKMFFNMPFRPVFPVYNLWVDWSDTNQILIGVGQNVRDPHSIHVSIPVKKLRFQDIVVYAKGTIGNSNTIVVQC